MKHQYKERFAGVRKIALLPLCAGVLALFSFTEKPVLIEPVLPMVSVSMKVETPEVVSNEKKMDSVGDEKCFLLLDSPKIVHYIQSGEAHLVKSGSVNYLLRLQLLYRKCWIRSRKRNRIRLLCTEKRLIILLASIYLQIRLYCRVHRINEVYMYALLNGRKKIHALLWPYRYIMTGTGYSSKRDCP